MSLYHVFLNQTIFFGLEVNNLKQDKKIKVII